MDTDVIGIDDYDPVIIEFAESLIEKFENFLSARKIDLKNSEPDDGWPDPSAIRGSDYEEVMTDIIKTMEDFGLVF